MKVRVQRDVCIGAANCVVMAPTVFKLDSENKAVVLDPASVKEEVVLDAAKSCPVEAIIVEDDQGNQVYP